MKNTKKIKILTLALVNYVSLFSTEKPNILFLFADDHAYDSIGLTSNGYVRTPTIDKLALEGVYFERAYNMGSWKPAVCVASRTMLISGRSLWHAKKLVEERSTSNQSAWTQSLKKVGYSSFFTGKWHIKEYNPILLFDHCGTIRPGMPSTFNDNNRPIKGVIDKWSPSDRTMSGYWEGGKHWSELTAEETIDFLRQREKADDGKPFFAYVSFNAPHDPRQSPQNYLDLYDVKSVPLPNSFMPSYPYTRQLGIWGIRAEKLSPRPRTEFAVKKHRQEYYALISHLDAQIDRILNELDRQNLRENTIVIYTADHGLSLGNHSFFAKQSMYDHSLASPFIISGKNIPKGIRSKQRIYIQDAVPTCLELAGVPKSEYSYIQFKSLLPLSKNGTNRSKHPIYGAYCDKSRCIIEDNWKLTYYSKIKKFQLFNLDNDPFELVDVIDRPDNLTVSQDLLNLLKGCQKQFSDDLIIPELK